MNEYLYVGSPITFKDSKNGGVSHLIFMIMKSKILHILFSLNL